MLRVIPSQNISEFSATCFSWNNKYSVSPTDISKPYFCTVFIELGTGSSVDKNKIKIGKKNCNTSQRDQILKRQRLRLVYDVEYLNVSWKF